MHAVEVGVRVYSQLNDLFSTVFSKLGWECAS